MKTVTKLLPGCAIALVLAAIAKGLESWEASGGLHLIGASVIALFLGMIVNRFYKPNAASESPSFRPRIGKTTTITISKRNVADNP